MYLWCSIEFCGGCDIGEMFVLYLLMSLSLVGKIGLYGKRVCCFIVYYILV